MLSRLTDRERAILYLSLTGGLVTGFWLGLWSVPGEALAVPSETVGSGDTEVPAYRAVPNFAPILTVVLLGGGAWAAYCATNEIEPEEAEAEA